MFLKRILFCLLGVVKCLKNVKIGLQSQFGEDLQCSNRHYFDVAFTINSANRRSLLHHLSKPNGRKGKKFKYLGMGSRY